MKKYFITMYQKGKLNYLCTRTRIGEYISYEKCSIPQTQILIVDDKGLNELYEEEKNTECLHASKLIDEIDKVLGTYGTYASNPYKYRNELREIRHDDKDGFVYISINDISKETEKAYYIDKLDMWIPKSQTIKEDGKLHIKRWVIYKN